MGKVPDHLSADRWTAVVLLFHDHEIPDDEDIRFLRRWAPVLRLPPPSAAPSWVAEEFGRVDFVDGRLRERLLTLARDFYARPLAPIPQACNGEEALKKLEKEPVK